MKRVFLTGATGAIGSALAPLYLEERDTSVALLLRGKQGQSASARLHELGKFWGWRTDDSRWSKLKVIEGDVAIPKFGVSESDYAELAATTSHIVHCAGAVKMTLPLEEARAHAVVPARAAIELAERNLKAGVLQKLEIVSTVGVGGRTSGLIPERPLPEVKRFHNTYEAAKAEAEKVVFERCNDLPITVHRPSMVVGDSTTGRIIHFQVFYQLCEFLSGNRTRGLMPSLDGATLDIVPVDYVARAIHWSSQGQSTTGRILHLCSGPDHVVPLARLVDCVRALGDASNSFPPIRFIPPAAFRFALPILLLFAPAAAKRALANLHLFLAYLEELQTFSNASSAALLGTAGIHAPHPDSYLDTVLRYYRQRGALSKPSGSC